MNETNLYIKNIFVVELFLNYNFRIFNFLEKTIFHGSASYYPRTLVFSSNNYDIFFSTEYLFYITHKKKRLWKIQKFKRKTLKHLGLASRFLNHSMVLSLYRHFINGSKIFWKAMLSFSIACFNDVSYRYSTDTVL